MDMKLFRVIIISISVLFGSGYAVGEMPVPKWIEDDRKSYVKYNFRYTQYLSLRLSKDEKNQHKSAVYFMLNSIPNGEIVTWHSAKRLVTGKVRVIQSYPISSGYCRMYQTYIRYKSKHKQMTNNACKYIGSPTWFFYK